jgi:diguanylate cyclase (GGDEF)-like protein
MTTRQNSKSAGANVTSEDVCDILSRTFDGIALWKRHPWRIAFANSAFWSDLRDRDDAAESADSAGNISARIESQLLELVEQFDAGAAETLDASFQLADGRRELAVRLCRVPRGQASVVATIVRASADGRKIEQGSLYSERLDPLTGLPDREFLVSRMTELLRGERVSDRRFAVLFLDLDNFKQVNDEFGHLRGDAVLRAAARRIEGCLRERDFVARYGGDEFVAIIEGITLAHEVRPVIERIQITLSRPIELPEGEVSLTLSVGVEVASGAGGTPEELLAAADRAMYTAKRSVAMDHPSGR